MEHITPNHYIALGFKYESWMAVAAKIANFEQSTDLLGIRDRLLALREERGEPCPVYINLDKGDTVEEQINHGETIETLTPLSYLGPIEKVAAMPDACTAGSICVGGVVAARNAIFPDFHSADICCSVYLTEVEGGDLTRMMDMAMEVTHFGNAKRHTVHPIPSELEMRILENPYTQDLLHIARSDLGTQGDGNHFLFVGTRKSNGRPCIVTHHGSRRFGARVFRAGKRMAHRFAKSLRLKDLPRSSNPDYVWIPMNTQEGADYWEALMIVRDWTELNHKVIHDGICKRLSLDITDHFWNEHNFVFERDGLYYHAKGATPGWGDRYERTLVPLNMAESILITRGIDSENSIGFLPHGAGRNIGRTEFDKRNPGIQPPANIDHRPYNGVVDTAELPEAYKSAEVVREQIIRYRLADVTDEVLPYGSIMAGYREMPWLKNKDG